MGPRDTPIGRIRVEISKTVLSTPARWTQLADVLGGIVSFKLVANGPCLPVSLEASKAEQPTSCYRCPCFQALRCPFCKGMSVLIGQRKTPCGQNVRDVANVFCHAVMCAEFSDGSLMDEGVHKFRLNRFTLSASRRVTVYPCFLSTVYADPIGVPKDWNSAIEITLIKLQLLKKLKMATVPPILGNFVRRQSRIITDPLVELTCCKKPMKHVPWPKNTCLNVSMYQHWLSVNFGLHPSR